MVLQRRQRLRSKLFYLRIAPGIRLALEFGNILLVIVDHGLHVRLIEAITV